MACRNVIYLGIVHVLIYCSHHASCSSGIVTNKIMLEELIKSENSVVSLLLNFVKYERQKIKAIESYIASYEKNLKASVKRTSEFLKNPLQSYMAIKHFSRDWDYVSKYITYQMTESENLLKNVTEVRSDYMADSVDDMYESASNLFRLHLTYNLSLVQFAKGNILNSLKSFRYKSQYKFEGYDCLLMALVSATNGYKNMAFDWLDMAEGQIDKMEENSTNLKPLMKDEKALIHNLTGSQRNRNKMSKEMLRNMENKEIEKLYSFGNVSNFDQNVEDEVYMRLCRGQKLFNHKVTVLKCWYRNNGDGRLILQPIRVEEVSRYPKIWMLHDFIGDSHIEALKNKSEEEEFLISMVTDKVDSHEGKVEMSSRISINYWMSDSDNSKIENLSKKIEAATGLPASDLNGKSEMYQVANYPIGGRYISHHDYFSIHKRKLDDVDCGDRILTFMMYLNDVEEGGSTVFTNLGINIRPIKGSAVMWWNLDRKGDGDDRTYHGGCPVLYGTKWIANKWICFNSATFLKPCTLKPDDYF